MMNIGNLLQWLVPGRSARPPEPGMHVGPLGTLHYGDDTATLALGTGARHTATMAGGNDGGLVVRIESRPAADVQPLVDERRFPIVESDKARAYFFSKLSEWRGVIGGAAVQRRSRWPALLGGFVLGATTVIVVSLLIASQLQPSPQVAAAARGVDQTAALQAQMQQLTAGVPGAANLQLPPMPTAAQPRAAGAPDPQEAVQGARLTDKEKAELSTQPSIRLVKGDLVLTAFSDPLCPACQDLERQSAHFASGHGFTVVPVAFQNGSRDLVAQILCSPDPAKAWSDAMRGDRPKVPACEKGYAQVDSNNQFFARMGATATPTLVAPSGQLAAGSEDAPKLMAWTKRFATKTAADLAKEKS